VLAPASGLSAVARALLQQRQTVFPMAEYQLQVH